MMQRLEQAQVHLPIPPVLAPALPVLLPIPLVLAPAHPV